MNSENRKEQQIKTVVNKDKFVIYFAARKKPFPLEMKKNHVLFYLQKKKNRKESSVK